MSRALITLASLAERNRAHRWIDQAPPNTRVEFRETKRSLPQNARLWAHLSDIARQYEHCGRHYTPDEWKILMMHAWGREVRFVPSLDGKTFVPFAHSSSDLSKDEMAELITFIECWAAENGIVLHDPESARAA